MKKQILSLIGSTLLTGGLMFSQNPTNSDENGVYIVDPKASTYDWENNAQLRSSHCNEPNETLNTSPVCDSGTIALEISSSGYGHFNWYDASGWFPYFYDSTYTTNILYENDTIYVESACPVDTNLINLPNQASTFSTDTRGYWFVAPVDFAITGLRVPTDASTADQNIEVLRFNTAPPEFNSTTNDFVSLAYYSNVAGTNIIDTYIPVHEGDTIGVLGVRGNVNSYGTATPTVTIAGNSVTLTRLGFQDQLQNTQAYDVWSEVNNEISRVEMYYSTLETSDSTMMIAAVSESPDSTVAQSGTTLISNESNADSYTWIDCNTNQPIPGETSELFEATSNGEYKVVVENDGCDADTSECITVSSVSTLDFNDFNVKVYPNPNNGYFTIEAQKSREIKVYNNLGQLIQTINLNAQNNYSTEVKSFIEGVYYLKSEGISVRKVVVTK